MNGVFVKILHLQRRGNLCDKYLYLFNYKPFVLSLSFPVLMEKKGKKLNNAGMYMGEIAMRWN